MKQNIKLSAFIVCCACAEPFATDKHSLVDFRIAAMKQFDNRLSASVWGEGLCHVALPSYKWTIDGAVSELVSPDISAGAQEAILEVRQSESVIRKGRLPIGAALDSFEVERTLVSSAELSLESRRNLEELPFEGTIGDGQALRIHAQTDDTVALQWMTAFGHGTLLELDSQTVDFYPERIAFEDGVAVEREAIELEQFQILALAMDGRGANQWRWLGIEPEASSITLAGGWGVPQPSNGTMSDFIEVTLRLNDTGDAFVFEDPQWAVDLNGQDHTCWSLNEPFVLDWILDGQCSCDDVIGKRVVFEVAP